MLLRVLLAESSTFFRPFWELFALCSDCVGDFSLFFPAFWGWLTIAAFALRVFTELRQIFSLKTPIFFGKSEKRQNILRGSGKQDRKMQKYITVKNYP